MVTINATYDALDVKKFFTMNLKMRPEGTGAFPDNHDNADNSAMTGLYFKIDLAFDDNTWTSEITTVFGTSYVASAEWPLYYDIKAEDAVIESMPTCNITSYDPGSMSWSYERKVYVAGTLVSTNSGSTNYTVPATEGVGYFTRPYLNFDNWNYPLPSGPWTWITSAFQWQYKSPAPMCPFMCYYIPGGSNYGPNVFADYDTHPLDQWKPYWPTFMKNSEPPGFEVHEAPGGHRFGYYVERSLGATEEWMDYTATTTYGDGLDENFRIAPTYFIDGPKNVYQILQLKSTTDDQGKTVVPIIDVFYYRRKDQNVVTPWRIR